MKFLLLLFILSGFALTAVAAPHSWANLWAAQATQDSNDFECPGGKTIHASDVRTQLDVQAFVQCAKAYVEAVGIDRARVAFKKQNSRWLSRYTYIFVDDNAANGDEAVSRIFPPDPKQEGKAWGPLVDFFNNEYFQEVSRVVSRYNEGWTYYAYRNPDTRIAEPKFSYVARARVGLFDNVVVGGGLYQRGTSNNRLYGTCPELAVDAWQLQQEPSLRRLQDFVRCAAAVYVESGNAVIEVLSKGRWRASSVYIFAVDTNTKKLLFNARDWKSWASYGRGENPEWMSDLAGLADRNVVNIAVGADESFMYYKDINPATGHEQRKVVFLKRTIDKNLDAEILIASGYYLENEQQAHGQLSDCSPDTQFKRSFTKASLVETREDIEAFVRNARCFVKNNDLSEVKTAFHTEGKWLHRNNEFVGNSIYLWVEEFDRNYEGTDFHNAGDLVIYGHPTSGTQEEGKAWGRELIDDYENSYYPEAYRMLRQQDSGWIYYSYPDPAGKTSNFKSTFVALVEKNGKEYMVAAGLWDRSVPGACEPNDINATQIDQAVNPTPRMLQDFVRCAVFQIRPSGGQSVRHVRQLMTELVFSPRWHFGSIYISLFDSTGFQILTDKMTIPNYGEGGTGHAEWPTGQHGPNPRTDIFTLLNSMGEMFLHYNAKDPKTGRERPKLSFIKKLPTVNNYVSAGYYID